MQTRGSPRRGELYWLDWNPVRGSEQAGRRPALVVSNDRGNETAPTVIVAALTSRISGRRYPFQVFVSARAVNGLTSDSTILCHQLITVSKERLARPIGILPPNLMVRVDAALKVALGLN